MPDILWIIALVVGIVYGYVKPGRERRGELFRRGVLIGIVLAIILTILGLLAGGGFLLLGIVSGIAVFIEVVILTILFVIGTWIGDWLEARSRASRIVPP